LAPKPGAAISFWIMGVFMPMGLLIGPLLYGITKSASISFDTYNMRITYICKCLLVVKIETKR